MRSFIKFVSVSTIIKIQSKHLMSVILQCAVKSVCEECMEIWPLMPVNFAHKSLLDARTSVGGMTEQP